jgi:hypothetical protein
MIAGRQMHAFILEEHSGEKMAIDSFLRRKISQNIISFSDENDIQ